MMGAMLRRTLVLLIAAGAATLAACGSASYEYVRNTEARTAFKVPIEWTVFDEATLQGEPAGPPVNTPDPVEWLIGLDGHPSPTVEHVLAQGGYYSEYPQGIAAVLRLTAEQRDGISYGALRNLILPIDQIQDQVGREAVQLLAYDDRVEKDGFRGLHFEAQIWASALEGGEAATGGGPPADHQRPDTGKCVCTTRSRVLDGLRSAEVVELRTRRGLHVRGFRRLRSADGPRWAVGTRRTGMASPHPHAGGINGGFVRHWCRP
jgi:hypothetical protein